MSIVKSAIDFRPEKMLYEYSKINLTVQQGIQCYISVVKFIKIKKKYLCPLCGVTILYESLNELHTALCEADRI